MRQILLRKGLLQELLHNCDSEYRSKSNSINSTNICANQNTLDVEIQHVSDIDVSYHGLFSFSKRYGHNTCSCSGMKLAFTAAGLSIFVCYLLTKTNIFVDFPYYDFGHTSPDLSK